MALPSPITPFVVFVAIISFLVHKFSTRVSPSIPYAGEGSFISRLLVPVQYGKDPITFLTKTREKLGDVFCVDLIIMKIVFFLGMEGNKVILKGEEDKVSFWESVKWTFGHQTTMGESSDSLLTAFIRGSYISFTYDTVQLSVSLAGWKIVQRP